MLAARANLMARLIVAKLVKTKEFHMVDHIADALEKFLYSADSETVVLSSLKEIEADKQTKMSCHEIAKWIEM